MYEREWTELGKIDYFLEHLARAIERGEVPRASYDALAPRYLERRSEITSVLERVATRATVVAPAVPTMRAAEDFVHVQPPSPGAYAAPAAEASSFSRPSSPDDYSPVQDAPRSSSLSWTTVLIFTGAFLVIVAAAVFAIAAWQLVSPTLRFAFLGVLTLAFYSSGSYVRTKLELEAGGVALTVVASAMLVFDGWILIDGFGLSGPMPWAVWLLLCSGVYWLTETKLAGGFFGAIGAAAQVAWWWLLGEGLGWSLSPRFAVIALILVAWAITSRRIDKESPLSSLGRVLGFAAPAGAVALVLAALTNVTVSTSPIDFVSVAVVGWAFSGIVHVLEIDRRISAVGHVPLVLLAAGSPLFAPWQVALFTVLAVAHVAYELRFGGVAHGVIGLLSMVAVAFAAAGVFGWSEPVLATALAVLALTWAVASRFMLRTDLPEEGPAGRVRVLAHTLEGGAWVLLAVVALSLTMVTGAIPLTGARASVADALLAGFVVLSILAVSLIHRRPAAPGSAVVSFYALWAALSATTSHLGAPLYATALVVLVAVWFAAAVMLEQSTGLERALMRGFARIAVVVIALPALAWAGWVGQLPSWQASVLLATVAVCFLIDGLLVHVPSSLAVTGIAATASVAVWTGWRLDGAAAGVAASATALGIAGIGVLARRAKGVGDWAPWAAIGLAIALSLFAWSSAGSLALAFALLAIAAALATFSSRVFEGVLVSGLLAAASALAWLSYTGASSWMTVVVLITLAALQLAPSFVSGRDAASASGRIVRSLAVSGVASLLVLVALGAWSTVGLFSAPAWAALDGHAFAVAVAALGAYSLAASTSLDLDPTVYLGVGLLVLALWIELAEGAVTGVEWYSTSAGIYVAWCGYRWASLAPGRDVPPITDLGATSIVLGAPALMMLDPFLSPSASWNHTFWAFGLALVVLALGVLLRVRVYFFASVAALLFTSVVRSWTYLVTYWWIVLGVVGTTMIVVALRRERRAQMFSGMKDVLEGWR